MYRELPSHVELPAGPSLRSALDRQLLQEISHLWSLRKLPTETDRNGDETWWNHSWFSIGLAAGSSNWPIHGIVSFWLLWPCQSISGLKATSNKGIDNSVWFNVAMAELITVYTYIIHRWNWWLWKIETSWYHSLDLKSYGKVSYRPKSFVMFVGDVVINHSNPQKDRKRVSRMLEMKFTSYFQVSHFYYHHLGSLYIHPPSAQTLPNISYNVAGAAEPQRNSSDAFPPFAWPDF